ncbi:MAG: complex I 51 kDa subunit family protein, partial [Bacteroidota bacterium]
NRKPVDRLMLPEQKGKFIAEKDISVFDKQKRIVLRNNGLIDPEKIEEYIAAGGYTALGKVLDSMSPDDVIEELKVSEISGRGGAGFPTWLKWLNTKKEKADKKYIICNGDEGDPGAFMDRSILEGDPHAIIEAMTIAAYTAGASKGYFYIRAEYVLAIKRVKHAIKQAYKHGVIGEKVMGSDFSFDLDIRLGAGAFVCGEETALIASVEGKRGTPSPRPPYPSQKGLFEKPTLINNVETLANIPEIINKGGKWFATIGTKDSKGTKVFALTGKINISGLIEVPMGTTIKDIIYEMGGGIANGKKVKAVQTGGPSGGIIPEQYFDTPIDYKNLQKLGSMMGSGGMIVMDEDDSMVDIAKFYIGFSVDESCGKCAPCRIGNYQMFKILERFTKKRGKEEDIEKLKKIALAMQKGSLCGLGQTSPNPVVSTLRFFEEEYLSNTRKK